MRATKDPQTISAPALVDLVATILATHLEAELSWLTTAYGKIEKISATIGGTTRIAPAIYTSNNEYETLFPDDRLGNFCYFENYRQEIPVDRRPTDRVNGTFGLVFFYDYETVYPGTHEGKTREHVKADVLAAIRGLRSPGLRIEPATFYDEPAEIYRGYDHQTINHIYKMRPYGGFKLAGSFNYTTIC